MMMMNSFTQMASVSDYISFRNEFTSQYAYVQYIHSLFVYVFFAFYYKYHHRCS